MRNKYSTRGYNPSFLNGIRAFRKKMPPKISLKYFTSNNTLENKTNLTLISNYLKDIPFEMLI